MREGLGVLSANEAGIAEILVGANVNGGGSLKWKLKFAFSSDGELKQLGSSGRVRSRFAAVVECFRVRNSKTCEARRGVLGLGLMYGLLICLLRSPSCRSCEMSPVVLTSTSIEDMAGLSIVPIDMSPSVVNEISAFSGSV